MSQQPEKDKEQDQPYKAMPMDPAWRIFNVEGR